MAGITPLNNFLGPESDPVTEDTPLPKYQSTIDVCRNRTTWRGGRCGGTVGGVGVLRALRCHLRAGFQQCQGVGQERLGPSYLFIPLVLGPLNSLVFWELEVP